MANDGYLLDGARTDAFQGRLVPGWWKAIPHFSPAAQRNRHDHGRCARCQWRGHACRVVATLSGSNGTIFYPYFGSSAVAIRAAVTGNVYAEII
jgi:hypothetical protein